MFIRAFNFAKNILFLVGQSKEIFSLIRLFLVLAPHNFRSASSMLYYSTESLSSVLRYKTSGKSTARLKNRLGSIERRSNTVFILGSGPSVNEHTQNEWNHIKKNDSWGFNLWFCNDFVPTVYVAQALVEQKTQIESSLPFRMNDTLRKMLQDKQADYRDTSFYYRGDAVNQHKFYDTVLGKDIDSFITGEGTLLAELPISSTNKISPGILMESMYKLGFFKRKNVEQNIPKFGSTITELISFALILGYKEIVLCGIDMNDGGHFYDNETSFNRYPLLRELSDFNHNRTASGGHEHMDTTVRPYTIKDYVVALRDFGLSRFGAKIFVMKEASTLYPEIEKYDYDA